MSFSKLHQRSSLPERTVTLEVSAIWLGPAEEP